MAVQGPVISWVADHRKHHAHTTKRDLLRPPHPWRVNSVCHFFGTRRFDTDDRSTNVFWLALPSLGESWHHNHHAFPRSAVHGLRRWEIDHRFEFGAMKKLGLAWNVVRISTEHQAQRSA